MSRDGIQRLEPVEGLGNARLSHGGMYMPMDGMLVVGMAYQRMRMQEASERLAEEIDRLLLRAKSLAPRQADHLERAADSVMYNVAEGIACYKPKMKTAAYGIARKEANEVRAVLRRLVIKKVFSGSDVEKANDLAGACVGMLTNAIKSIEIRPDP